jgi:hypothetical protein
VIYLVQTIGEMPKILASLTGDEERTLREKGLAPAERSAREGPGTGVRSRNNPGGSRPLRFPEQRD